MDTDFITIEWHMADVDPATGRLVCPRCGAVVDHDPNDPNIVFIDCPCQTETE